MYIEINVPVKEVVTYLVMAQRSSGTKLELCTYLKKFKVGEKYFYRFKPQNYSNFNMA